jgi:glycosyltransferase involved in cell wall biosynthesis
LKILYYSTAYNASHGGSLHSKAFVKWAQKSKDVEKIKVFPEKRGEIVNTSSSIIKKVIKAISVLQIYFFYRRNKLNYNELMQEIRKEEPDILHIRLDSNFIQIKDLKEKFPSLIITTEVNASPFDESFKNIACRFHFKKLEKKVLCLADANFFVSDFLRKRIMKDKLDDNRDFVVQNGVDQELFKVSKYNSDASSSSNLNLIYIGTLDHHKKVENLINALKIFKSSENKFQLKIIGDGPAKENLYELVQQLGLKQNIVFTNWIKHDEIPKFLAESDIAIHHLANDYMSPLKLFEYLIMGKAVIAPNTQAVKEVFTNEEHVLLTNGEPDDLALKISRLFENEDLRNKISQQGKDLVASHYTWEQNVNFIINRFQKLLVESNSN